MISSAVNILWKHQWRYDHCLFLNVGQVFRIPPSQQKLFSPLTDTLMVWWTEPSRFLAVQRYSPASASDTSVICRVLLKFWKEALWLGISPLSFVHETTGVGLNRNIRTSHDSPKQHFSYWIRGANLNSQAVCDALHLQNLSSQNHLRAERAAGNHEGGRPLVDGFIWKQTLPVRSCRKHYSCEQKMKMKRG